MDANTILGILGCLSIFAGMVLGLFSMARDGKEYWAG
jgi:hypothetical protein